MKILVRKAQNDNLIAEQIVQLLERDVHSLQLNLAPEMQFSSFRFIVDGAEVILEWESQGDYTYAMLSDFQDVIDVWVSETLTKKFDFDAFIIRTKPINGRVGLPMDCDEWGQEWDIETIEITPCAINATRNIHCAAAYNTPPKEGDIFTIVVLPSEMDVVGGKRDGNLNRLNQNIHNYLISRNTAEAGYYSSSNNRSYYHQFKVIAQDGCAYPVQRQFFVRITYPLTSIGTEHIATPSRLNNDADYGTIYITDTQKEFRQAETDAKAFIDKKIKEVHDQYEKDPSKMSDI